MSASKPEDGDSTARTAVGRSDQTYTRLRDLIVQGQLAPGSRIIETDVADRLGVSRTPVRSALERLEQEGFIRSQGRNGGRSRPVVAPLTKDDARELMGLIGALEGLAARRTASLSAGDREEVVEELRSLNGRMEGIAGEERPDRNRFFDLDAEFHRALVEPGAGPRLRKLHSALRPQVDRYVRFYVTAPQYSLERSVREHRSVVDALKSGRAEAVEEEVEENWRSSEERLRRDIDMSGERGSW